MLQIVDMNKSLKKLLKIIFIAVELMLVVRFVLKFFGASPDVSVVNYIYQNSEALLSPFLLAFPSPNISGKSILEFTSLFAIFTYAFINYLIQEALDFLGSKKK